MSAPLQRLWEAASALPLPSASLAVPSLSIPLAHHRRSIGLRHQIWTGLRSTSTLPEISRQTSRKKAQRNLLRRPRSVQLGIRALFTGIVEEMGNVRAVQVTESGGYEISVEASTVVEGVKLGDSIAVNGTCLTVTAFDSTGFTVGLSPETLRKTSLGEAVAGSPVNLERALLPASRMGGHILQGHVDGTGTIESFDPEGDSLWVKVKTSADLLRYVVPKGYIAVDGASLTVVGVFDEESSFTFMLVDYTRRKIVIPGKKIGSKVNLEVDIVGKYVERLLHLRAES